LHDFDSAEGSAIARRCPVFTFDAGLAVPDYIPSLLRPEGCQSGPSVAPPPVKLTLGYVLTADAVGHAAALIDYHTRLLQAAVSAGWQYGALRPHCCLNVDLVLVLPDEWPVVIDMFGGAQLEAADALAQLADPAALEEIAYDNLDQGWAVRVLVEPADIVVLYWNWEKPLPEQEPRALRLSRSDLALQAAAARQRLEHLHTTLKRAIGLDLWNLPPRPPPKPAWRRLLRRT
jgi:hypothetical protein